LIESYTGVGNRHVANANRPEEVLCEFAAWSGDSTLIAQNGLRFDSRFLAATCRRHDARGDVEILGCAVAGMWQRLGLARAGSGWIGLDRAGSGWIGLDRAFNGVPRHGAFLPALTI
jgi:hypothetical protein